jgi:hypothetical protein
MSRRTVAKVGWSTGRTSARRPRSVLRERAAASPAAAAPSCGRYGSRYSICSITALAAIAGSVVGGLASFLTTFFTQRNQAHRDLLSRDMAHREELYPQFIKEAANLYADSLDKTLENPASLIGMYSLVGRIRLIGMDKVLLAAEKIADSIVDSYSRPPATFDDVYKLAREGHVDPLKEFTEACREERQVMLKRV